MGKIQILGNVSQCVYGLNEDFIKTSENCISSLDNSSPSGEEHELNTQLEKVTLLFIPIGIGTNK